MTAIKNKFIYVATPRTGSRNARKILAKDPNFIDLGWGSHPTVEEVFKAKEKLKLPVYTFCRPPLETATSWLAHYRCLDAEDLVDLFKSIRNKYINNTFNYYQLSPNLIDFTLPFFSNNFQKSFNLLYPKNSLKVLPQSHFKKIAKNTHINCYNFVEYISKTFKKDQDFWKTVKNRYT